MTISILLLLASGIFAQTECGIDDIHQRLMQTDPAYKASNQSMESRIRAIINNKETQKNASQVYTIPVVVHIIHIGETLGTGSNISDAQINGAIQGLNARWRNQIGNGSIDMEFNFVLATRGPDGCPTTGINRVNGVGVPNYYTYGITQGICANAASETLIKNLSRWDNTVYYNIWVVNRICSGTLGGYAYYPSGDGTPSPVDGTVISYLEMKNSSPTLAHELGHGFNLKHTFQGDNNNANCPLNIPCNAEGDFCCDTPPQKKDDCGATNPCSTTGIWGNSLYNYMSYCHNSSERFTPDQKNRSQAVMLLPPRNALVTSNAFSPGNLTQPGSITGNTVVCGGSTQVYSISALYGAISYNWTIPSGWTGTSNTNSITVNAGGTGGNISVRANFYCGNSNYVTLPISVNSIPAQPVSITGNVSLCEGNTQVYSVVAVNGATSYTWTLPNGWTGSSTTNSITTTIGNTGGVISVKANNNCGSSTKQDLNVTVNPAPSQPGTITGNVLICAGSAQVYSVVAVNGANSYTWTLPNGWTGSSTTNSITVTAGSTSGIISVKANSNCGSSNNQDLNVTINTAPSLPAAITGNVSICAGSTQVYTVDAVNGATNYTWSLPQGWTGSSSTNTISVSVGNTGGVISVRANNNCGSSGDQTMNVSVNTIPAQPGSITGNGSLCEGSTQVYSVVAVNGASSYTWTLPNGWTGSSTTNSITVTAGPSGGIISVKANNNCGSSNSQDLNVTVNTAPSQLGSISGKNSVCQGNNETYTVSPVNGAMNYTWTLPNGWPGSSSTNSITTIAGITSGNISVKANFICGSSNEQILNITANSIPLQPGTISGNSISCQGSNEVYSVGPVNGAISYTWTLPNGWSGSSATNSISVIAGNNGGSISVKANNNCGSSIDQTISISVNSIPAQPGSIAGSVSICEGSTQVYTVTPVNGATGYLWNLPNGWSGTSASNIITVVAGSSSGVISVKANNNCGFSSTREINVSVNPAPSQPGSISGNDNVCAGNNLIYFINPVAGASGYTWTLPSGWTGTSSTNSINTVAGNTGGNISVKANYTCGNSNDATLPITVNSIPAQPATITGNNIVCIGSTENFSVPVVNGATNYTWTLPQGWTGSSSTNTIAVIVGNTNGIISVKANNNCGSSTDQSMNVSVNTIPAQPGSITGNTTVCEGNTQNYSISTVNGATGYTWTLPQGWTGTSTTNNITVTAGNSGGTISVKANNNCGSSTVQNLNVVVSPPPAQPGSITGSNTLCEGQAQVYSIIPVTGALNYTWTLPQGWTGSSIINTITVTAGNTGGIISVKANYNCGSSSAQNLNVSVTPIPSITGTISGKTVVCQGSSEVYSITPVNAALNYTWTLPAGWSGTSTSNSITAVTGNSGGNISVKALNGCGSSGDATLAVSINTAFAAPGTINGNSTVCQGSNEIYSVAPVAGATGYTWTLPSGWSGSSSTNSITTIAGGAGGVIAVKANYTCGSSTDQSINITVNNSPVQTGSISGNITVCEGSSQVYSVTPVSGATGYTWTLPQGWTGSSTTNSITLIAGNTGGTITVKANNNCGSNAVQSLSVSIDRLPATVNSIAGNSLVCQGRNQTYTASPVAGATSYTWSLPQGWTGSSTTNTITALTGNTGGVISVKANNNCGSSAVKLLNVSINPAPGISSIGDTILNSSSAPYYQWYYNNILVNGATSNSIKVNKVGFYRVDTSPDSVCWTSSLDFPVLLSRERVADTLSIKLYPNPSSGSFHVNIKLQRATGVIAYVTVTNVSGNTILQTNKLIFFGDEVKIPITLSSGSYFVAVYINGDVKTLPVIVL
jgi:hypothetical protein